MRPQYCPECRVAIARGACAKHPETVLVEALEPTTEQDRFLALDSSPLGDRLAKLGSARAPGFTLDSRGMFVLLEYVAELEARLAKLEAKPEPRGFFGERLT